ncbi:MAG TPA: TonB-dependent receptor, partial [Gemmatimonadales bacterium]
LANGVELLAFAGMFRSDGQTLSFPGLGTAVGADGERYDRQFAKLTAGDWTLQAGRSWRLKQIPTGSFQTTFNDPRARTTDAYSTAFLRYAHGFASLASIEATVSYDAYTYRGRYPYAAGLTTDYALGRSWSLDAQYVRLVGGSHRVVAGVSAQLNTKQDQGGDNVDSGSVIFRSHRASQVAAVFAQDQWRLASAVQATVGLRYDHYDTFGGTLNPRLAVVYNLPRAGTLKLLYGRAFRAPNAYEMDYQDGGLSTKAATGLKPERMESYEAVFEGRPFSRVRVTATGFVLNLSELITQVVDPADSLLVYRNLGRAHSQGVELEAEFRAQGGVEAGASVTFQHVTDPTTRAELPTAPHAVATARFSAPVAGDVLRASLSARYVGAQRSVMGAAVGASTVADVALLGAVTERATAALGVYNAFDARYSDPAGSDQVATAIPQNRRNVRLTVQVTF